MIREILTTIVTRKTLGVSFLLGTFTLFTYSGPYDWITMLTFYLSSAFVVFTVAALVHGLTLGWRRLRATN